MEIAKRRIIALSVAGSDSGAGAGVQADLKTCAAHGVYCATVLTLVTAQSTSAVDAVHLLPESLVGQQLMTVWDDFDIGAVKTGALGSASMVQLVAGFLRRHSPRALVVDPVMISKHGHVLLEADARKEVQQELLPLATVVTPNLHEAAILADMVVGDSRSWMLEAGHRIMRHGCAAVVIKGGHLPSDPADLLLSSHQELWMEGERIHSPHTHGTGCTYSAALAANLVLCQSLEQACTNAKHYINGAIQHAHLYGRGINPVNHFWLTDGAQL